MENEKIPNINKFKILTFNGACTGSLQALNDIKPILGKQLRIFKIVLTFYSGADIGSPYFVSKNNTLTADFYKKVKLGGKIEDLQIKADTSYYIQFKINNNLVFPSMLLPNANLDLDTNFITDKINSIEVKVYLTIYDGITDSFVTPAANFKIFCEEL